MEIEKVVVLVNHDHYQNSVDLCQEVRKCPLKGMVMEPIVDRGKRT
jgi:hypothetical protein